DAAGSVGRITTAGQIAVFDTGLSGFAEAIVAGPDGLLWIPDQPLSNFTNPQLAAINTSGQLVQWIDLTYPRGGVVGIAVGPDQKLWITQFTGGIISRVSAIHGSGMMIAADTGSTFSGGVATFVDGTP